MNRVSAPLLAAACLFLTTAGLASLLLLPQRGTAQEGATESAQSFTRVGLDIETGGNTAASLGIIDSCTAVEVGDTFPVDIFVRRVRNLLAWEVYLQYDRSLLQLLSRDVRMFLNNRTDSNVVDVSDPLPSRSSLYRLAAADIASPAAPESGSGVLTRVTFQAKTEGVTPISLPHLDFNSDGVFDLGPRLIGLRGLEIGDADGDGFLDDPINSGRVVIGSSCEAVPEVSPTPYSPTTSAAPSPLSPSAAETPGPDTTPAADSTEQTVGAAPGDEETQPPSSTSEGDITPPTGVLDEGEGAVDSDDGTSFRRWIAAFVGGLGALGLLLAFAALRQATRHS